MNDSRSYVAPYALGATMTGGAIGRVVESRSEDVPVGSIVQHQYGWRDVVQEDASGFQIVPDVPGVPRSLRLGMLGMTGMTAYVGLTKIAGLREGETVFVSGAAGAVGTAAGQIAKLLGAKRVIGSAGGPEKVALLTEKYGYDVAFDYKMAPVRAQLARVAPEGIDVFYDNVGGDHLEAALDVLNDGGRAALCGAISGYNVSGSAPGPDNLANLITRGLRLEGFTLGHHMQHAPEFRDRMTAWFSAGKIAYDETIVDGIDHAVDAFLDMMRGGNIGKMLVRIRHGAAGSANP
jgi:NADPH-dependent curcumin reductase CurA